MAAPARQIPAVRILRTRPVNGHPRPLPAEKPNGTPPSRLGASSIWRDPVTHTRDVSVRHVTSWPNGRRLFADDEGPRFSWLRVAAHVAVIAGILGLMVWGASR